MNLEEINKKYESYKRTEKALENEFTEHVVRSREFHFKFNKFIKEIKKDGYIWTNHGWDKEVKC